MIFIPPQYELINVDAKRTIDNQTRAQTLIITLINFIIP